MQLEHRFENDQVWKEFKNLIMVEFDKDSLLELDLILINSDPYKEKKLDRIRKKSDFSTVPYDQI
jgi:hypothetical protein